MLLPSVTVTRHLTQRSSQLLKRAVSTQISLSEASEALQYVNEEEKENASKEKPTVKSPPKLDREKVRTSSTGPDYFSVLECLFRTST